jgi:hypothetical protein
MKILFKFLQYIFKFLASIFSKLGAQYTYTKLYKYFMKYKFISIIYKPLKFIFNNIIYFIKLSSAIIAILSLFNISLFYFNFDVIDSIDELINEVINYIKALYKKWFCDEEDEISEPIDFFHYRKNIKVIEKSIQQSSNNSYWILPLMIIGYGTLYYFNPNINLDLIVNHIDAKIPSDFPKTFVAGTFIYKFIIITLSYFTGDNLIPFTGDEGSLSDEDKKNIKEIIRNCTSTYSPTDELNVEERSDFEAYFSKDEDKTPKALSSNLPEGPPHIENPFKKIKIIPYSPTSSEIKIEDWD